MKDQIDVSEQTFNEEPKARPMGIWARSLKAYRYKMQTDQNFHATVVALQIVGLALFLIGGVFLLMQKSSFGSDGMSFIIRTR